MKIRLLSIFIFCGFLMAAGNAFGAAATMSFTPTSNIYSYGTAITSWAPTVAHAGSTPTYSILPALPTGLAFSTTTGTITGTPLALSALTNYTVTLTPGGSAAGTGTPTAIITITVNSIAISWVGSTGGTSGLWATATNWSPAIAPGIGTDVQIGVAAFTQAAPTLITPSMVVNSLKFGSATAGSTLTITSPGVLSVTNAITVNTGATGTISGAGTVTTGSLSLAGTGSLTLTSTALSVTNAFVVAAGSTPILSGTGSVTVPSASFSSGTASTLTLTGIPLTVTNAFTVSGGASATLTGTGSITAGSAAFTSGTSSLVLNMSLPVTNAFTINAGAAATISGSGIIRAGSATFGTGTAASLTLTGVTLSVTNALSIVAGASATLAGTGSVSTTSLTFAGASAALTVTSPLTVTTTSDFTVATGATATITGTGNVNISPLATLNVVTTGVLTTTMTGKLTLKSDATGSASVGQILSTSIVGTGADSIHVERFITGGVGHRSYYLFSSPVYAATANSNKVYDLHYLQYAGMYLTGSGGIANGFDRGGGPTIYLYREDVVPSNASFNSGNFLGISKINNTNKYDYNLNGTSTIYNIPAGNGMMVFFRGNRTGGTAQQETYTTFITAPTVTLNAAGTLNAGQIVFHNWYKPSSANLGWSSATANSSIRGFNLVGNPYASSIDWDTYTNTNNGTGIYASANVSNTVYEFNMLNHNYDTYQKGTGGNGAHTGNATHIIVSGQGFYVQSAVDSTEQLIFNESAKVTTQNTGASLYMSTRASMAQIKSPVADPHLNLKLAKDSINTCEVYIGLNAAASTKNVFNEDAPYRVGAGLVTLTSLSSDNVPLTINKMPFPTLKSDTVSISVAVNTSGTYTLNGSEVSSMPAIYEVWLMDTFTKDSLDMRQNSVYTFNVDLNNGATFGTGRFKVIIRENPALAIHLLSFTGTKAITGAQINWTTENEQNYTNFTVERSTDKGVTFTALGGFASSSQGTYGYLDTNPLLGVDMYRLKITDLNGTVTYSNVVSLTYTTSPIVINNPLKVYPNPVSNTLNLTITPSSSTASVASAESVGLVSSGGAAQVPQLEEYSITIVNNSGAVLKKAVSNKATWQADVSNFMPGSYVIQVVSKSGKAMMGQCVFIKL